MRFISRPNSIVRRPTSGSLPFASAGRTFNASPTRRTLPTGNTTGQGKYLPIDRINAGSILDTIATEGSGFIGTAAQAPARIIEAPFAAVNRLAGGIPSKVIGGTPVGGVFGFLGEVVNRVGNAVPALLNSQDADLLLKYKDMPDDFVIPDWGESTGGGLFGIGSRQLTLGEKRAEVARRGFDDQSLQELYSGKRSIWDFGDRMIHDSAAVDLAGRLALDPTNLLFTPGIAGKLAAKFGLSSIGRMMGATRFSALGRAGARVGKEAPDINWAARAATSGPVSQMAMSKTIQKVAAGGIDLRGASGLARGIGAGARAFVSPRGWTTRTGFFKRSLATYGTLALAANAPSGMIDGLKQFAQDTLSDQPLSRNSAFILATAMGTPVTKVGREVISDSRMTWWRTVGTDFRAQLKNKTGMDWEQFVKGVGGEERALAYVTSVGADIARDTLHGAITEALPALKATGKMSQLDVSILYGNELREHLIRGVQNGKIKPHQIVDRMVDMWQNPEILKAKNALVEGAPDLPISRPWHTDDFLAEANEWLDSVEFLGKQLDLEGEVAIGFTNTYTKEKVQFLEDSARAMSDNGMVRVGDIHSFLNRNKILLGMAERESLVKYYTQNADEFVPVDGLLESLRRTRDDVTTPTDADYYAEDRMYELNGLMHSSFDPTVPAINQIRERLAAVTENGTPVKGMEQWHDHWTKRLTAEVANNVRRGDSVGDPDIAVLKTALYKELRETVGDGDQIVPGMENRHEQILQAINAAQKPGENLSNLLRRLDLEADQTDMGLVGLNLPDSEVGLVYRERLNKFNQDLREVSANYTAKKAPVLAYQPRPGDTLPDWLIREHNAVGEALFDPRFNVLGAVNNFTRFLFTPVEGSRMARDAEQAVYNELVGRGAKPQEISRWLQAMRKRAVNENVVDPDRGIRLYGRINALLPHDVNRIAVETFGADSPIVQSVGQNNFFRVLDRSSSRLLRDMRERARRGGKRGRLKRLVDDAYWTYRSGGVTPKGTRLPVATGILGTSRLVTNTLYPIFRFMVDPRWHMMNRFEATIYGMTKEGVPVRHIQQLSPATRRMAGRFQDVDAVDSMRSGHNLMMADPTETGWYHQNRITAGKVSRNFDSQRVDSVTEVLEDMWNTDPGILKLRRDFPSADPRSLAQMLDDQLYNFDTKGVGKTLEDEYRALYAGELDNAVDPRVVWEHREVIQRLAEVNQKVYDDLVSIYVGNPNRTNIERVMNSYWLFWPISYQIKASKWLLGMLSSRAFGNNTNLLGAWRYDQIKQYHLDQMANNAAYREQFEGNEALWQLASMFFPITPEDIGVNLGRPTRMATALLGITKPTQAMRDPISAVGYTLTIGPAYTADLLAQWGRNVFEEPVEQGILFDDNPETPQSSIMDLVGVTTSQPITGSGLGESNLPGTTSGSVGDPRALSADDDPYNIKTFAEGGQWLDDEAYADLMAAREAWDSRT